MARGDVFNASLTFPDGQVKRKHQVMLQGGPGFDTAMQVAVVVASTDRRQGRALRPTEVLCTAADGFDHDTVIECRWVYTRPRAEVEAGGYVCTLSDQVMTRVDAAL